MDEFFGPRNLLYLGDYQRCLDQLSQTFTSDNLQKQVLQCQAHLGLGDIQKVLEMTSNSKAPSLQLLHQLAAQPQPQPSDTAQTQQLVALTGQDSTFAALAAQLLIRQNDSEQALRLLSQHSKDLPCLLLQSHIYLSMGRIDLSQKLLQRTQQWSEDSPLLQLMEAWTLLYGYKPQEAMAVLEDLVAQQQGVAEAVWLALAVAKLQLGFLPEAQSLLEEIKPSTGNSLANLHVAQCLQNNGSSDLSHLRLSFPEHPFVQDLVAKESLFESLLLTQ